MTIPHIDLRLQDCELEVWFNDFPIHRVSAGEAPKFLTTPVAEFVREGMNVMTVIPNPGPTPSTSRESRPEAVQAPPEARFEVALVFYEPGDFPGSGAGRAAMAMSGGAGEPMPSRRLTRNCSLRLDMPSWSWERSSALMLTPELGREVVLVAKEAHGAFSRLDVDFFLGFGHLFFVEIARAYPGIDFAERERRFRSGFAPSPGGPAWQVAPFHPENLDMRLCADGRLIELIDKEFRPVLRSESMPYPFSVMLGRLDGRFQMLR